MLFISLSGTVAHADDTATQPFNPNYKYTNGVGNLTVWLNYSRGVDLWENYITSSVNNWMYTGWSNPVYMTFVNSNYGSNLDFHSNSLSWFTGPGTLAVTWHFINGTCLNPNYINAPTSSWYYAEIHICDDNFLSDSFSNSAAHGTVRHEIGHALRLKHNNTNPNSIMCQHGAGRVVQTVQYTDNLAVVNLY